MNEHNKPADKPEDAAFLQRAADVFDASVQDLDAQTRSRLNQGRQQALAATDSRVAIWNNWVPLGAAAAVAVVAVVMWNGKEQAEALSSPDFTTPAIATDFEILLDEDDLEMLEDLEFYSWIDLDEAMNDADPDEHVG